MHVEPRNSSFYAGQMRRVNHVRLDHQIVVQKFRRITLVRQDPADFGGSDEHHTRTTVEHVAFDLGLAPQIEFAKLCRHELD